MVGSAVWRALESKGYNNLIGKTSAALDLRNQQEVLAFYAIEKPEVVVDATAKVGGILTNNNFTYQFLMENMQIQNNLIDGAFQSGVGIHLSKKFSKRANTGLMPYKAVSLNNFLTPVIG